MAIQTFQLCIVLTIGFSLASATLNAVAKDTTSTIPLSLDVEDPEDVTVARGHSATLHCKVTSPKLDYNVKWLYNDTLLPDNDSRWFVQRNGSLNIPKIAGKRMNNSLEGTYRCKVQNADGALISNQARLRIASLREFLKQPENVSVSEFQPIIIPCSINSNPKASVHWERDDSPLPQNTRYVPLPTGSLLITSIHSSDVGSYRCKVLNSVLKKTKLSKPGKIKMIQRNPNIVVPPKILPIDIDLNVTVLVGNDVTLYCVVDGWPRPAIRWINDLNVVVGNSSVLVIRNVTVTMTGKYTCSAHNSGGRVIQSYFVSVHQIPYFNVTPMSKIYPSAKTIRLDCQAVGVPEPKIVWYKNGKPFSKSDTYGRAHEQNSGLIISYSVTADAGLYQCMAVNAAGIVWSSALVKLNSSMNSPRAPMNVTCNSYNDTSVCLQWTKVPNAQAYSILAHHSSLRLKDYVTNETYKLADNLIANANYTFSIQTYSNEASNEFVQVSCQTGRVGFRNLTVEKYNEVAVKLVWSEISTDRTVCGGDQPNSYKVQWKKVNHSAINVQDVFGFKKFITGIQQGVPYEFRVQSTTVREDEAEWVPFLLDFSENSTLNFSSKNDLDALYSNESSVEPVAPYQLDAEPSSTHSINLTWADSNIADIFYTVCYISVIEDRDCQSGKLIKSVTKGIEIKNLKPNTEYEFKVRAHNADGLYSPYSYSVQVATPSDVPSAVVGLKYKIINTTSACVKWEPPLYRNGHLTEYLIKYAPNNSWPLEKWYQCNILITQLKNDCWGADSHFISTLLENLEPEKQYIVIVIALNDAGAGNPTIPITISTKYPLIIDEYQPTNKEKTSKNDDIYQRQVMGVILGVCISAIVIFMCVNCIICKRKYMKVRNVDRARLAAANNHYPTICHQTGPCRQENGTSADTHEMQHLVEANGSVHIPPHAIVYLDTKGGAEYPNGQLTNGNLRKKHFNGTMPNSQVHITENPQYFSPSNNKRNNFEEPHQLSDPESYEEDSNSNLQKFSLSRMLETRNGQVDPIQPSESPIIFKYLDNKNHDVYNSSLESNLDTSLNTTQLTNLDDSQANRKISSPLGPNG